MRTLVEAVAFPRAQRLFRALPWRSALLFATSFFLGRATLLGELYPFPFAFFAVVFHALRERWPLAFFALGLGALLSPLPHAASFAAFLPLFFLAYHGLAAPIRSTPTYLGLVVAGAVVLADGGVRAFVSRTFAEVWPFALLNGLLAFALVFIFLQALPLLVHRGFGFAISHEELVAFLIVLGSLLTGMLGVDVGGISLGHIVSRGFLLLLAHAGGATVGATAGVLLGLVMGLGDLSYLEQLSLLAFSGLLGGLLRPVGKAGTSLGFFLGAALFTLLRDTPEVLWSSTIASLWALGLFWLVPEAVERSIARLIPGSPSYLEEEELHFREVRAAAAERIRRFADLFARIGTRLGEGRPADAEERKTEALVGSVARRVCHTCFRREICWKKEFEDTYRFFASFVRNPADEEFLRSWRIRCPHVDDLRRVLEEAREEERLKEETERRFFEVRLRAAEYLGGLSLVLGGFAGELDREPRPLRRRAEELARALEREGYPVHSVELLRHEPGRVEVRVALLGEVSPGVTAALSRLLGEPLTLAKGGLEVRSGGLLVARFLSTKRYHVEVGVVQAAAGGGVLSGDSTLAVELSPRLYLVGLSDGMGNGERARFASQTAVDLLREALAVGVAEDFALRTVNTVLALQADGERFATLDFALVDLRTAEAKFLKVAAPPTFIRRGDRVFTLEGRSLPVGVFPDVHVEPLVRKLVPGDLLVFLSDGVYEARPEEGRDAWFRQVITRIDAEDPHVVADLILEKAMRLTGLSPKDDMTVVAARIEEVRLPWAVFSPREVRDHLEGVS